FLGWATAGLALTCAIVAIWAYPNYFPYLSAFGMGKPGYALMNDSNLDWNQALPDVERFVQQRGLNTVLLDEYGFSEPEVYAPKAQFWNCQEPARSDAGKWAVVSAGMIEDGHNCPGFSSIRIKSWLAAACMRFNFQRRFLPRAVLEGHRVQESSTILAGFHFPGTFASSF